MDNTNTLSLCEYISDCNITNMALGSGNVDIDIKTPDNLFYEVISQNTGINISSDYDLMNTVKELSQAKSKYDKFASALEDVKEKGYGIVNPGIEELKLEEPQIVKQGNKYGVLLKASAPSIHMICNKPKFLKTA